MTTPFAINDVYVTATGAFLPGGPVGNDEVEAVLGQIGERPSRHRLTIQSLNGITSRHYAVRDGRQTHLNEEMAALAVEAALARRGLPLDQVGMLAVGTTLADLLMPGFGTMVHGRLGAPPLEVLSAAGICASGAAALQHAWTAVLAGRHGVAVAGASELASVMMRASRFAQESRRAPARENPAVAYRWFNAEFLRWMLSDGAGAVVLENRPHPAELSLRVDWIELTSYAGSQPVCMFLGTSDPRDVSPGKTWLSVDSPTDADREGMLVIRQDTDLLGEQIVATGAEELARLVKMGRVDPDVGYQWFLPHISSYVFAEQLEVTLLGAGLDIPAERWFTNLATKGNTGSASFYIMLDEALTTGRFQPGDRILAFVPESGRFTMSFMQFTCVEPG
jgi:3-oxoacyl-[acyl-carrier-protein] synthase-3